MYPYITCQTCNKSLGEYYLIYSYLRLKLINNKFNSNKEHIDQMDISDRMLNNTYDKVSCEHVLDHIGITKSCCRVSMVTQQIIVEYKHLSS